MGWLWGGALTSVILFSFYYQLPMGVPIAVTTLLTGIVCTSRFIASDHTTKEIYIGLLVGSICQIGAYLFVM